MNDNDSANSEKKPENDKNQTNSTSPKEEIPLRADSRLIAKVHFARQENAAELKSHKPPKKDPDQKGGDE